MTSKLSLHELRIDDSRKMIGLRVTDIETKQNYDSGSDKVEYLLQRVEGCKILKGVSYRGSIINGLYKTNSEGNAVELETIEDLNSFISSLSINKEETLVENLVLARYFICKNKLDMLGIPLGNIRNISSNSRMSSRWGVCKRFRRTYDEPIFDIEIAERLMISGSYEGIDNTIIHELLHTCSDCFKHTGMWKYYAEMVCDYYGYDIKRLSSAEEKGTDVDELLAEGYHACQCTGCGLIVPKKSECKFILHPEWYTCGKCGSKFIRIA